MARELGVQSRTSYRWCWWLRNTAVSYETDRQLEGTVEADDLYQSAGQKGQAQHGGKKALGHRPRGCRKKREPGRGHYDKDWPAIMVWGSRQGAVVIHATRDFTVKTVQKEADLAVHTGSRLYTDSASSYRAVKGYIHEYVNHTQKEGFDHGVGHSLLVLCDAKAPHGKKWNDFKGLENYHFIVSISLS
jgi:hypothetical protein